VEFRESGHINLESYSGLTNNGVVSGVLSGGSVAGNFPVTVRAGGVSASANVTVNPLNVEVLDLPDTLVADQKYDLTARVTGGSGESLSNIFIDIGADAGSVTSRSLNTNSLGVVNFTYK